MGTLRAITRRAATPLAGHLAAAIQVVGALIVTLASGSVVGIKVGPAQGVAVGLGFVLVLAVIALWRTQRELEERGRVEFDCFEQLEQGNWPVRLGNQVWRHGAIAWVWVTNEGPTAQFAADIRDVTGVPWDNYFVAEPLWDGKHSPITEIPHGQRRKLKVASVLRKPRGFWFWTSEQQSEGAGWQWPLGEDEADVGFTLAIVNMANDQAIHKKGRITIPLDTGEAEFTLKDG